MEVIDIEKINIGNRKRALDTAKVKEIAESISRIGLLNPITLSRNNGNYELVAGLHRLEACKALGHTTISAIITDFDGLHKELAEIDENLIRNELHYIDRGEHLKRRDEILTELGMRAESGTNLKNLYKGTGGIIPPVKTTTDIAKEIGISESLAHKEKQIARNLDEEVKEKVKELDLPKTEALNLARLKHEEQKEVIQKIETGQAKKVKQAIKQKKIEAIKDREVKPLIGKYDVILADPPWQYDFAETDNRKIENHYPTMSVEEIANLQIPADNNAVLFLWATAPKLREALLVMETWGFEYKTHAIWDKGKIGMGYWFRGQHELLLVGVKGKYSPPQPSDRNSSIIKAERTKHSEKPNEIYGIIEKMCPNGAYLELFARQQYSEKWSVWGNHV
jgi:N6-adenosine-specific RNA methylase IME4